MRKDHNKQEPFLVQSPITGQYIDLLPFFEYVQGDGEDIEITLKEKYEYIDDVVRLINTGYNADLDDISNLDIRNMFQSLYRIRDMFQNISVIKDSIKK